MFGIAASGAAILSVTGQGDIKFKRPNNNTSYDITLATPTPTAVACAAPHEPKAKPLPYLLPFTGIPIAIVRVETANKPAPKPIKKAPKK